MDTYGKYIEQGLEFISSFSEAVGMVIIHIIFSPIALLGWIVEKTNGNSN